MIKFRQKQYAAPLVAAMGGKAMLALSAGSTALSMKQAHDAEKQNEEIADQQRRDAAKTRAALDRLAESGASPESKSEAASLFSDLRTFAMPAAFGKLMQSNAGKFAKDMWKQSGGGIKKAATVGAGFAGVGYVGNKIASMMKNHDEGQDDKNKSFLTKAALGTAAIGGSILAAKKGVIPGKIGESAKAFLSSSGKGGQVLKKAGNFVSQNISPISKKGKGRYGVNAMNTVFMGMPVVSYMAQRGAKDDMVENTAPQEDPEQKQYAASGFFAKIGSLGKQFFTGGGATRKRMLSGAVSKAGNFVGMMGGQGGTTAVQNAAQNLKQNATSVYTKKLADWAIKNPNQANLAAGVATAGVGTAAVSLGGKLVDKPMKMLDKEAYKMEDQENGKV